jgi:hypothetical protein
MLYDRKLNAHHICSGKYGPNMDQMKVKLKPLMPNLYTKLHQNLFHDSEIEPSLQSIVGCLESE